MGGLFILGGARLLDGRSLATFKIGRDAGNGQFIPVKVAQNRPKTTVIETIKTPKK